MRIALFTFAALCVPALARGADIPCGPVEPGVIQIDGLLEDWSEVPGLDVGGASPDLSFTVKCNYDQQALYLAIDVRDDFLVRTRAARPVEDHVEIAFADGQRVEKLSVHPGDAQHDVPHRIAWSSRRSPKDIDEADALQPRGYAVELRMPLASVPGFVPGAPSIRLAVAAYDCDSRSRPAVEATLATAPLDSAAHLGQSAFAEAQASLDAFLKDRHLASKDITFDRAARVLPTGGGRVVVAGRTLAMIGEDYSYLDLPVASPRDILDVRVIDLAGDGRDAVVIRYRETTVAGEREVLAAYRMSGEGLHRAFGVEVARRMGENRLDTRVSFVRRGAATDILVEAQPPTGWTEVTWRERPAEDVVPIPLPWSADRAARFQFRGDEYLRADEAPPSRRPPGGGRKRRR